MHAQTPPPLISIALCTYNGERYLAEQLASLQAQCWPRLEIVIVDDGSSDGSWRLIERAAQADARIRAFRNASNLGTIANFSLALSRCKGALLAPCDQDDIWHPQKLQKLVAALGDQHLLAYCDSALLQEDGHPMGLRVSDRLNMYQGGDPTVFAFSNCVSGHAMLFRRELLLRALPMPPLRFHDWWLAFVAASLGSIVYVDEPLVGYRQHAAAQTDMACCRVESRKNKRKSRIAAFHERRQWLRQLASLPSPSQPYFIELDRLWQARTRQWFAPQLVRHLALRADALLFTHKKKSFLRFALRQFWGLKTKQLFSRPPVRLASKATPGRQAPQSMSPP